MPEFRHVQYANDGIEIYQCLGCHEHIRTDTWGLDYRYCPYCGGDLTSQRLCRRHTVPRWVYQRYGNEYDSAVNPRCNLSEERGKSRKRLVIERRTTWRDSEPGEWQVMRSIAFHWWKLDNWRNFHQGLQWAKGDDDSDDDIPFTTEYRWRIVSD